MNCRYCQQPINGEIAKTFSYWNKVEDVCHLGCKVVGEKEEAYDCQRIDADCNDCKHFKRGSLAPKTVSKLRTPDGRIEEVTFQEQWFYGHCLKFDKATIGQPNKWTGKKCFEHRRTQ